jgi:hypothetical protein
LVSLALASWLIGVGSSSFVSAVALVWIGGMVFFGLGSLLDKRARQHSAL